jgi:hypothetical protein
MEGRMGATPFGCSKSKYEQIAACRFLQKRRIINKIFTGRVIDYGYEDGRFLAFASWAPISNPDSLSSSEAVVNP